MRSRTTLWRRVGRATGALALILLFFVPVLYVLQIALESPGHFLRAPLVPPTHVDLGNFGRAWRGAHLGLELANTALYSVVAAAVATVLSLLIAFPIARRLVRFASSVYALVAVGLFLPLAIIPLFVEARLFGLYDNRLGYILLHVEPGLPLGVVLLTAFVTSVPVHLDEAAWMDGVGYLRYLVRIVLPMTWPAVVITFLYALLGVWNDIIGPVVYLVNPRLFPVTVGIFNFYGANESEWTLLAAAIVVASLPVVALFAVSHRQLIRSAIAGSVKG